MPSILYLAQTFFFIRQGSGAVWKSLPVCMSSCHRSSPGVPDHPPSQTVPGFQRYNFLPILQMGSYLLGPTTSDVFESLFSCRISIAKPQGFAKVVFSDFRDRQPWLLIPFLPFHLFNYVASLSPSPPWFPHLGIRIYNAYLTEFL